MGSPAAVAAFSTVNGQKTCYSADASTMLAACLLSLPGIFRRKAAQRAWPQEMNTDDADAPKNESHEFPWADVEAARNRQRLQQKHNAADARAGYGDQAKSCPGCGKGPDDLAWFYFESPAWTWEKLCGQAGWMTVCDACHLQVDFFVDIVS